MEEIGSLWKIGKEEVKERNGICKEKLRERELLGEIDSLRERAKKPKREWNL